MPYCRKHFWTRQIATYCLHVYKNQQTGSRNLMGPKTLPTIWDTYMKRVTKYQISAINSCCEKLYCFTSVRLSVLPSFRPSNIFFVAFFSVIVDGRNLIFGHKRHIGIPYCMKRVTKYQISAINSCCEKCDEKCAYMFNVYKNQLSRQTGSRNLMGPKTLPTIWYTCKCHSMHPHM
jgi:hypothetical protein